MKNISLLTISLILIFLSSNVIAQVPDTTLAKQYEEVVIKSGSYKVYKNIRKTKIEQLWKNVNDSLKQQQQLFLQSKAELEKSAQTISAMQAEIDSFKAAESSMGKLSNIGTSIKDSSGSIFLWAALVLLAVALAYAIFRMRMAVKEASYRSGLYDQLFEELREHRSKANEREKKLARELQTERNKVAELTGR